MHRFLRLAVTLGIAAVALSAGWLAWACTTPVFRYAMYRWESHPYSVFYLHHGTIAPEDEATHKRLREVMAGQAGRGPNLQLDIFDASKPESLKVLPREVLDAWKANDDGKSGTLLVFNPSATLVHAGKLAATEVDGLADSPLRQKLCKLLADDHAVVWIVREGRDAEANAVADTALKALMADVATGKYRMPDPATADLDDDGLNPPAGPKPSKSDPAPAGDSDANAGGKPIRCAIVKIAVDDRQDPWLLKMLDAVDQDDALPVPPAKAPADEPTEPAADSTDSEKKAAKPAADTGPRVYAIYGRARAMPAIAGKHVTHAVLTECLAYLSGPCSCTIKDENPGVDLLTTWNWEATAEALMKDDPLERARAGGWMVGDEPQPAAGATVAATQAKADASDKTAGEPAVGAAVATPTHTTGVESAQSTRGDEPTVGGVNVLLLAGGGALLAVLLIAVVGTAMLYARRG